MLPVSTLLVGLLLVILVWRTTPWQHFPTPDAPSSAFSQEEITSAHHLRSQLRLLSLTPWALTLIATIVLALFGARLSDRFLPDTASWLQTFVIVVTISLVMAVIRLPFAIASLRLSRRAGLSTTTWATWLLDLMKNFALSVVITWAALFLLGWAARTWSAWWAAAALGAAGLTVVISFLMPVIFEPIFNKFTPMSEGPLRTALMELAQKDGVPVRDVLVADASRRTTALNAYVSGFGATRRIVVYDTLIQDAPQGEIESVVAHELGHAKAQDVVAGTAIGAVAAALAVLLLALVMGSRVGDPRFIPAVLAVFAILSLVQQPFSALISRNIELRADAHALTLTQDPKTYADMQRRLALVNRADLLTPRWVYLMFATHPSTMERITFARQWPHDK